MFFLARVYVCKCGCALFARVGRQPSTHTDDDGKAYVDAYLIGILWWKDGGGGYGDVNQVWLGDAEGPNRRAFLDDNMVQR